MIEMNSTQKAASPGVLSNHLTKNLLVIGASVVIAVYLASNGVFERILASTQGMSILGSFIAGMFYSSFFTTAPATVALGEIAQEQSVFLVAFLGGLGAVIGDLVLFRFLKTHVADEFVALLAHPRKTRYRQILRMKSNRWFLGFLGALVIASPLPDELGLTLMGIESMKAKDLIPLSFILNALGILVIGLVARGIGG